MQTPSSAADRGAGWTVLGTPEQIAAERKLIALLADPEIKRLQDEVRAELAQTPRGQSKAGAATLDHAIALWTNSVILSQLINQGAPQVFFHTDNTPRTWFGHTLEGVGACGDNPDAIYRGATLEAGKQYEVLGRFDMARRPSQWVLEVTRPSDGGEPGSGNKLSANKADMGNQIAMYMDRDLQVSPEGAFRIPLKTEEKSSLLFRDMLSDWRERPSRLTVRLVEGAPPPTFDDVALRERVRQNLQGYIRFWANYLDRWLGGVPTNTITPTIMRDSGWGFLAGIDYKLAPDEAIVFTTAGRGSTYTGTQFTDPWMMTADVRHFQNSLNKTQSIPSDDGTVTYVLAMQDPGVANWLDTAGVDAGRGILRWQGCPPGAKAEDMVRQFKLVKLSDVAAMNLPRVTPAERARRMAERKASYEARLT